MQQTKGEQIVAGAMGELKPSSPWEPVLSWRHPFLRRVIGFMERRTEWRGTVTELLSAVGDHTTPPNTAARLLRNFELELYHRHGVSFETHRTGRRRLIILKRLR